MKEASRALECLRYKITGNLKMEWKLAAKIKIKIERRRIESGDKRR